jgi:hypothetical protein
MKRQEPDSNPGGSTSARQRRGRVEISRARIPPGFKERRFPPRGGGEDEHAARVAMALAACVGAEAGRPRGTATTITTTILTTIEGEIYAAYKLHESASD